MDKLIYTVLAIAGVGAGYAYFKKNKVKIKTSGMTPEAKVDYIRSAMHTAESDGDWYEYTRLQRELEFAELETGL